MAWRNRRAYWRELRYETVSAEEKYWSGADAADEAARNGDPFQPVTGEGRKLAKTPWGLAWCRHVESFHDFSNRLPRGRTYLRQGLVVDLRIGTGRVDARVSGSELYAVSAEFAACTPERWRAVVERCRGEISSLVELLEGRFSREVMERITSVEDGLLPDLFQVTLRCSCPDWAQMCKHLAAALYGVGVRLDAAPELLFTLRGVDPRDLIDVDALPSAPTGDDALTDDLSELFGVEIDDAPPAPVATEPQLVRRSELIEFGIPAGTITGWLRRGILKRTDERGWYEHTTESLAEFARRFGE